VKLSRRLAEIRIACNVVAIEDRPGLVSADLHRDRLPYPGSHQISHGAASEVMPEHPEQSGFLTGSQPGFPEISKPTALEPSLSRVRKQIGHHTVELARQRFDALDLFAHQGD